METLISGHLGFLLSLPLLMVFVDLLFAVPLLLFIDPGNYNLLANYCYYASVGGAPGAGTLEAYSSHLRVYVCVCLWRLFLCNG